MADSFSISFDDAAAQAWLDKIGEAAAKTRPAAQAGIDVLYKEILHNVNQLGRKTGNLASSIYQAFSADNSGPTHSTYHASWNARKAPHGQLVEYGHVQRYKQYQGRNGQWYTMVRPSMRGKPRPSRKAPQAVKDAYYVPLAQPRLVAAAAFVRRAFDTKQNEALIAARDRWYADLRKAAEAAA